MWYQNYMKILWTQKHFEIFQNIQLVIFPRNPELKMIGGHAELPILLAETIFSGLCKMINDFISFEPRNQIHDSCFRQSAGLSTARFRWCGPSRRFYGGIPHKIP
jgi:hypothetical protein